MSDNVSHPSHYTQGGIECIKAIEASMSPDGFQDYCKGNVMKYLWRWRDKDGVEDLKKASVYLNWLIESAEKDQPKDTFVHYCKANGKELKIEYVKVDPSSLDAGVREYYFYSLVYDLRQCSSSRGCSNCERRLIENGCDLLESDAADAIEFLLKELKEKENSKEKRKK